MTNQLKILPIILALAILAGCATGERVRSDIQPGISRAAVIHFLGNPDALRVIGEYEILGYSNRLVSGWSWNQTDYYIVLKNGRVVEYGHGAIRDHDGEIQAAAILGLALSQSRHPASPPVSETPSQESCPCPYSIDAAGNLCGSRSAWSRAGGRAPVCY